MKTTFSISAVLLLLFATSSVFAFSFNPPDELTGAPGEGNCTQCHAGNVLNAAGGSLMLTVPENYLPGEVYDIVVNLSRSGQSRWGFEMTALNSNGARAGTFATADANTQLEEIKSKQYIQHTSTGTAQGKRNANSWTFKWTAPSNNVGPITFYAAGNAANGDFGTAGDYIYTQKATSDVPPVYGVTLAGVGSLTKSTADASTGVTYTLRVTNSGNTNDVIRLSTSGSVNATLSRTSISLAAGASTNVTLTVRGTASTTAGDYAVKVTATSQGESTKTAEVTATTTILPVYRVTLAGVGNLTRETTDASTGVSYTLRVTNSGNTNDTVRLTTSGDATATVSPSSVSLNQGASRTVTLRIPGTALAKAGEYAVKVTATSRGNSTKTAEVTTTTTILPVYDVSLTGIGSLTTETTDASAGVTYTLNVTNNGNTDDVINLAASDDDVTLSQSSVSLASGASTSVTLTIPSAALATAGEYVVKVTATSQGDSTKTAEVSTTTTVLPVYGVTLTGVGDLTKETADASAGVSYTLNVTNNGNTDDVINLATSDDDAILSQTSVSLASGASTNVTLIIPSAALATAGEYVVKVTATSQGDSTKTAEVSTTTTILPVYGVTLTGNNLTKQTQFANAGVSYALQVTNTGNTEDTIVLGSSAEVGIGGSVLGSFRKSKDEDVSSSQLKVTLAPGASTEVIFTATGDLLTKSGVYQIKVTATSQGDSTKTAEITTTTTILPIYGVMLAGVGDLTTETSDASEGISYMLTVTNTGNANDVINLATSDDDATLSQSSVLLAAGASAEVTLTVSVDALATAGDYEVKVTATSQGDSTKTAEITTTTTVLSVYGVTLVGDNLIKQTQFASGGVSYALQVTNTGNTEDTIVLGSSAEVGIGGSVLGSFRKSKDEDVSSSQLKVTLAPGASTEVIFTATGDLLTKSGVYQIKVTATSQGDSTKTAEVSTTTTILPVYGVALVGEGALTGSTMDTVEGVTYTLIVTNTGNTDDTIVLGSSAEVGIEGSVLGSFSQSDDQVPMAQLEIVLVAGASAEVIFTAAGDFFTKPGEYEIKVTATSQGDNTKTAEITTTTTITVVPPVYGVMLQGKDELTGATMDILAGVSYTLTVTNTGNVDDTIVFDSSAAFGIEGSVLGSFKESIDQELAMGELEIALAAGASVEVIFTAAGDFFTKPGEYEIKVTATSQGDSTKTAEITTKTTIEPVPWDVNADGTVNIQDLVLVANQFGESGEGLAGDVNKDGQVNILDLVQVASYFGKSQAEIVQANQ
ncbi:MAG: dockerin type I domain-containing protein [Candidatus Poribacteria bacterium]|nr:dockerin type I domain-containing protein [Candidatus Poribacteria bacterium]